MHPKEVAAFGVEFLQQALFYAKGGTEEQANFGHGGYAGKSLIEKIRDDLDITFKEWTEETNKTGNSNAAKESFIEGICHALGVLRSTSADEEWELAEGRLVSERLAG